MSACWALICSTLCIHILFVLFCIETRIALAKLLGVITKIFLTFILTAFCQSYVYLVYDQVVVCVWEFSFRALWPLGKARNVHGFQDVGNVLSVAIASLSCTLLFGCCYSLVLKTIKLRKFLQNCKIYLHWFHVYLFKCYSRNDKSTLIFLGYISRALI